MKQANILTLVLGVLGTTEPDGPTQFALVDVDLTLLARLRVFQGLTLAHNLSAVEAPVLNVNWFDPSDRPEDEIRMRAVDDTVIVSPLLRHERPVTGRIVFRAREKNPDSDEVYLTEELELDWLEQAYEQAIAAGAWLRHSPQMQSEVEHETDPRLAQAVTEALAGHTPALAA